MTYPNTTDSCLKDNVNHPGHYTFCGIECIDVIEILGLLPGFCLGSAIKYIWRRDHKGSAVEDLKKSVWYLNKYIQYLEKNCAK
jgi:hypothetical protein